uniref:hypothetical protein n=1 Tax=Rheinheimera sp. TaxID=1869214 RepID=UPI0040473E84
MPSRKQLANAIRALSMDAVQKAKSGHPGAPMGMADIAEVLVVPLGAVIFFAAGRHPLA